MENTARSVNQTVLRNPELDFLAFDNPDIVVRFQKLSVVLQRILQGVTNFVVLTFGPSFLTSELFRLWSFELYFIYKKSGNLRRIYVFILLYIIFV